MKIPLRPSRLTVRRQTVRWLILHHSSEIYENPEARIDNSSYQTQAIFKGVLERKEGDVNYHYVIEKVKEDYIPIVTRPFVYLCEWPDIDVNINNRAIHICLLGNYDFKVPDVRLYEVLAYRVLNPFLKMYRIAPNRIKFHRDVSSNEDLTCPGEFVNMGRVISLVRRFVIK